MEARLEEQKRKNAGNSQQMSSTSETLSSPSSQGRNSPHGRRKLDQDLFQRQSREDETYNRSRLGPGAADSPYNEGGSDGKRAQGSN